MQIKLLKQTIVDTKHVKAGEVIDTDELTAKMLIGMSRAEIYTARKQKTKRKSRSHV